MAKKEKTGAYEPFCGIVCERIRLLRDKWSSLKRKRERLFKARDNADAEIEKCDKNQEKKLQGFESDYGKAIREINQVKAQIKEVEADLDETIMHADQSELFPDPKTFNRPDDGTEGDGDEGEAEDGKRPAATAGSGVGE